MAGNATKRNVTALGEDCKNQDNQKGTTLDVWFKRGRGLSRPGQSKGYSPQRGLSPNRRKEIR